MPGIIHSAAMRAAGVTPQRGVLPAGAAAPSGRGVAAAPGPDLYGASGVRGAADGARAGRARTARQSQGRAACAAGHGLGGGVSEAPPELAWRAGGPLSVLVARPADCPVPPSVGGGHHVHPPGLGLGVSGRHPGVVQSLCVGLGAERDPGQHVLCAGLAASGSGGGAPPPRS